MYPPPELVALVAVRLALGARYVNRLMPELDLEALVEQLARPGVLVAVEREVLELAHLERHRRVRFRRPTGSASSPPTH